MQLSLLVLVALAVVEGEAAYDPTYGFGNAGLVGNFGYDYSFGAGIPLGFNTFGSHHNGYMPEKEKNLKLTCQNGDAMDGLGITIEEKKNRNGAYAGYGQKLLGKGQENSLNATIELITQMMTTEPVSIIVTEKGFVTDPCNEDNFGVGVSAGKKKQQVGVGVGALGFNYGAGALPLADPYYGYTAGAYGGGLALGPVGALSYGFSPVGYGGHHSKTNAYGKRRQGDGLITSIPLGMNKMQTLRLDSVGEFNKLSDLAGRGLIVCTETDIGYKGKAQCVGMILNCCVLGYDSMNRGAPV